MGLGTPGLSVILAETRIPVYGAHLSLHVVVVVPSGVWAVSAVIVAVACVVGGAEVVPRPVEGREGRPRNRRLRVWGVPGGPLSCGGLRVLEEGEMGVICGESSTSVGEGAASLLV